MEELLKNYRAVMIRDCNEPEIIYTTIMLNWKHKVKDFEDAIYDAKIRHEEEIAEFGDDLEYILNDEKLVSEFDWFVLDMDADYLVV